jgi:hypothetical protein
MTRIYLEQNPFMQKKTKYYFCQKYKVILYYWNNGRQWMVNCAEQDSNLIKRERDYFS